MLREHRRMTSELDSLAQRYSVEMEAAARRVLVRHKRLRGFVASMGLTGFSDAGGLVDYDRLPKAAAAVIDMAEEYCAAFGSPGIEIEEESR